MSLTSALPLLTREPHVQPTPKVGSSPASWKVSLKLFHLALHPSLALHSRFSLKGQAGRGPGTSKSPQVHAGGPTPKS